ncbi:RHS repeat-associated core domain-containing protein [Flavobacterium columnare]|uniref:RHS repeat-associated core domain-containing protein n=1 Tax=Flavobacterium columnare TaxID=996 RepID=UPI00403372AD
MKYYPFGSLIPNRHGSSAAYRYGFNGKENDNEIMGEGNFEDYGMRMYMPRIGRFFNVDPLTRKFPMLTPYQFASNTPIWAIDLDGLEAAKTNDGVETLVITIQGYAPARDTEPNKTQAVNHRGASIDYGGLSYIAEASKNIPEIQVVVYSSSMSGETKKDVVTTIKNFKSINPKGRVVLIGHSLGADNAVEIVNENPNLKVDLLMTLDIMGEWDSDNIPTNVNTAINFRRPGGEDIEPDCKNYLDIVSPNSTHTSIDDDLYKVVSDITLQEHSGKSATELFKTAKEGVKSVPKKETVK